MEEKPICKQCGELKPGQFRWGGRLETGAKRFRCKLCGTWGNLGDGLATQGEEEIYTFVDNGQTAEITATLDSDTINSPQKLMKALNIDETVWEIYKKQIGKAPAWRKDRSVNWEVQDGVVLNGSVRDSGKIKVVPVFTVKVWMKRKTEEIRTKMAIEDFRMQTKMFAPKIVKLAFPKVKKGFMYEVEMPDMHFGKLTWGEETGEDSDLRIQVANAEKVICELLSYAEKFPVSKILFPLGHDFYNVDNQFNTTSHGTPQQEDTRWRKTFRIGWQTAARMINMCAQIAEVDVWIVSGNHDEERSFYLGEVLSSHYSNTKRVSINNSPRLRKYYPWGRCLIGLTHGYHEPIKRLKDLMPMEEPILWAGSKFREWHTGDKHHKEDFVQKTNEDSNGVVIRILRSLTTPDAWHYNKGYIGALKASEGFLWDKNEGLKAQFTATP